MNTTLKQLTKSLNVKIANSYPPFHPLPYLSIYMCVSSPVSEPFIFFLHKCQCLVTSLCFNCIYLSILLSLCFIFFSHLVTSSWSTHCLSQIQAHSNTYKMCSSPDKCITIYTIFLLMSKYIILLLSVLFFCSYQFSLVHDQNFSQLHGKMSQN